MTATEYLLNIALVGLVVLQIRGRRLDWRTLLLPIGLVAWAASKYLHGIPGAGNDHLLVATGAVLGLGLGVAAGLLTRVERDRRNALIARASIGGAAMWVLGIGARMGFALYAQHGGGPAIARFSEAHQFTSAGWVTAFLLMAFGEVLSRTLILVAKARLVTTARPDACPAS